MVKRCSNICIYVKKNETFFGWFIEEEIRGNNNYDRFERMTGLKEGGRIEIENLQVLSILRNARFSLLFFVYYTYRLH